jgi:hypothetical protein
MKKNGLALVFIACVQMNLFTDDSCAALRYVNGANANPMPPYTNWATAARVIQDAVDLSTAGDRVLVTNGLYRSGGRVVYGMLTNRVALRQAIVLESVSGPVATVIEGNGVIGDTAVRCVYLTNGCSLIGFTLTNGATLGEDSSFAEEVRGGGLYCESESAVVSNCILTVNSAYAFGGGACSGTIINSQIWNGLAVQGGGTYQSTLDGCLVASNSATFGGGCEGTALTNCLVASNWAGNGDGGGINDSYAVGCTLSNNSAQFGGGGASEGLIEKCIVINNRASDGGGTYFTIVNNSILRGNSAQRGGGARNGTLNNCVIVQNDAPSGGGTYVATVNNSIVYYNTLPNATNEYGGGTLGLMNCCVTPIPPGSGNFTNAPRFVDLNVGNFRLLSNSPCINAGLNAYAPAGTDLDGNPRVSGGTVDVGAYEFESPASTISYAWLARFNLVPDGSTDSADPDHDGMSNLREWLSDTDPTDPASVLKLRLDKTNSTSAITISWLASPARYYSVERSTNLATVFQTVQSNLWSCLPGTLSFTDKTAVGNGPFFYRVSTHN